MLKKKRQSEVSFDFYNNEIGSADSYYTTIPIPKHLELSSEAIIATLQSPETLERGAAALIELQIVFLKRCNSLEMVRENLTKTTFRDAPEYECIDVDNFAPRTREGVIFTQGIHAMYGCSDLADYMDNSVLDRNGRHINAYTVIRGKLFRFRLRVLQSATLKKFEGLTSEQWLGGYVREFEQKN